jgi:HPt (histidine-containing phosphotransfer) domain-containing protein
MMEILTEFVDGLPGKVLEMTDCLQKNDMASLRLVVHQLRGAAGGYGFAAITQPATSVEQSIDASSGIESIIAQTKSLMNVIRRIEGFQGSIPGPQVPLSTPG